MRRDSLPPAITGYPPSSAEQIICSANLKARYRELQELRERLRVTEEAAKLSDIKSELDQHRRQANI